MRVGLVARADDRGLGILTWGFYRHVVPDRTLVVREPGAESKGFVPHLDRYPGAPVVTFDPVAGTLPEEEVRAWLAPLDVVYLAETPYDFRFYDWCRDAGVATVLHTMPEFWPYVRSPELARPSVAWNPTSWMADRLPPDVEVVPVPVPEDHLTPRVRGGARPVTFLHVAGKRAMGDRNGTTTLLRALRFVRERMRVVLTTQEDRLPPVRGVGAHVTVEVVTGGVGDYRDLYADADVLVLPRRYGGLSLPVNEAAGSGLGLLLPDSPPHPQTWPADYVQAWPLGAVTTALGPVETFDTSPAALAAAMDRLAGDPDRVHDASCAAVAWAQAHSWKALLARYLVGLERACG